MTHAATTLVLPVVPAAGHARAAGWLEHLLVSLFASVMGLVLAVAARTVKAAAAHRQVCVPE